MSTILFTCCEIGELPAVAHQIPKLADIRWRNKASGNQIVFEDVCDPLCVFLVSLLAADSLDILWVSKDDIAGWLQNVVDGNPLLPCRLHTNIFAVVFCKPCGTTPEVTGESRKALARVGGNTLVVCRGNAGDKKRLVDIHSTADGVNDFQHNTSPQSIIQGNRQGLDAP